MANNNEIVPVPRLHAVFHRPVRIEGKEIVFNPQQQIYAEHLIPCKAIIDQHTQVWFNRKPGATAKKLRAASSLINGLMSTVVSMEDEKKITFHLHAAMKGKQWEDIITSIYAFRGASQQDRNEVKNHRYQLQNHLLTFLDGLKNLYEVHFLNDPQLLQIEWPQFLQNYILAVEAVDVEAGGLEGDAEVDANPLVQ